MAEWAKRPEKGLAPGIGVLIDTSTLTNIETTANPYYIVIDNQRLYGPDPETLVESVATSDDTSWIDDTMTEGVGIAIDMVALSNNKPPYYILFNGKRVYGNTPEEVLEAIRKNPSSGVANTATTVGAVLLDSNRLLTAEASSPHFIIKTGQCVYGISPEDVLEQVKSGNQGTKCPKSGVSAIMLDKDYLLADTNPEMNANSYYISINGWRVYGSSPENVLQNVSEMKQNLQTAANPSVSLRVARATRKAGNAIKSGLGSAGRGLAAAAGVAGRGLGAAGKGLGTAAGVAGRGLGTAAGALGRGLAYTAAKGQAVASAIKRRITGGGYDRRRTAKRRRIL